jgi:hypothetical protein
VFGGRFSLYDCCKAFCQSSLNNEIKDGRMHLFDAGAGAAPILKKIINDYQNFYFIL